MPLSARVRCLSLYKGDWDTADCGWQGDVVRPTCLYKNLLVPPNGKVRTGLHGATNSGDEELPLNTAWRCAHSLRLRAVDAGRGFLLASCVLASRGLCFHASGRRASSAHHVHEILHGSLRSSMMPKLYSHPINLQKLTCIMYNMSPHFKREKEPQSKHHFSGVSVSNSLYYDLTHPHQPWRFCSPKPLGFREPGARPLLQHSQLLHWSSPMNPKVSRSLQEPTDRWNWWALQCRRSWDFFSTRITHTYLLGSGRFCHQVSGDTSILVWDPDNLLQSILIHTFQITLW